MPSTKAGPTRESRRQWSGLNMSRAVGAYRRKRPGYGHRVQTPAPGRINGWSGHGNDVFVWVVLNCLPRFNWSPRTAYLLRKSRIKGLTGQRSRSLPFRRRISQIFGGWWLADGKSGCINLDMRGCMERGPWRGRVGISQNCAPAIMGRGVGRYRRAHRLHG